MLYQPPFPSRLPSHSAELPLTLISLEDWVLVMLNGKDTIKYLQGQLTCDVCSLKGNQFCFSAHCNPKGKMLSYLCVFHYYDGIGLFERRSVLDFQLKEMKKYAVFSKTRIIVNDSVVLLGLAGFQARVAMNKLFTVLPDISCPVVYHQNTTVLYFNLPKPRFLLITTPTICDMFQKILMGQVQLNNSQQWLSLEIEAGYPIIDSANVEEFIPQAVNIQALGGISFTKGCYIGQEIVARAKYRGANNRALYWCSGVSSYLPDIGDSLELKIGNNWKPTGKVLAACRLKNNIIYVQVVLNNTLLYDSILRVVGDNACTLFVQTLPYMLC
ncbi:folate-binding protein YgfZ [secondary endosymbiont of Heteropsylla cubana]|uniref:tRNA-modifying protein YgfZ n=1 Tax=secondary endosymbiont of Heteropsylla cubana TaxID=134287 RepID=J3TGP4_9ENTR|nr:tRNA-modifying protein YgfZ [secondary endosymbiont of Heteropsylla cubana]AFP85652.1 folate-binding protein YgfZ [secondary endosymbiont of Heteropsylla cubana]